MALACSVSSCNGLVCAEGTALVAVFETGGWGILASAPPDFLLLFDLFRPPIEGGVNVEFIETGVDVVSVLKSGSSPPRRLRLRVLLGISII